MVPKPKSQNDIGLISPIKWICREWVKKLGSNELDNNYGGLRSPESKDKHVLSKENCHRHNPRRSVLIYTSLKFDYKSNSCFYSVFLLIFQSPFSVYSFFYTVFIPSSSPSTCRLGFWRWSLSNQHLLEVSGSSCKVENYCSSITSTLMWPKS